MGKRIFHRPIGRMLLPIFLTVLTFFFFAYRLDVAPDIFMDEYLYFDLAYNIAHHDTYGWRGFPKPVFVHPPLFFLAESVVVRIFDLSDADTFTGVARARLLNAFYGALTGFLLYMLAKESQGEEVALLAFVIFMYEPFVVRINRRNMMETQAELLCVLAVYFFIRYFDRFDLLYQIVLGMIIGAVVLTKEIAVFSLMGIPLSLLIATPSALEAKPEKWRDLLEPSWWFDYVRLVWRGMKRHRHMWIGVIRSFSLGVSCWFLFPLWAWAFGHLDDSLENKLFNLKRLLGIVQVSGWNRPGVSFVGALKAQAVQYITSYVLIALAVPALVFIFLFRWEKGDRVLVAWAASLYAFFAFVIVRGQANDQFFYFLMVPVILVIASSLVYFTDMARQWPFPWGRLARASILLFLTLVLIYNGWRWVYLFGQGYDDSYHRLAVYINEHLPPGTLINASKDPETTQAMLPRYRVVLLREPKEIIETGVHYFIISSKDLWGRYGKVTPEYYEWVHNNGKVLFQTYGNSFWKLELIYIPY